MADRERQRRFERLLREHQRIVFKVAGAYSRSGHDRDDLAQEIAAQLWRSFAAYDPRRAKFSTWMYRVALNVAISHVRDATRHEAEHSRPFGVLFDAPVVVLQRRLAQLRRFRALSTLALGLPWWCLWLLVPMVFAYHWTGVDWFAAGSGWIWASMAVGVVGIVASLWLAHHLAGRALRPPFVQRIVDDMSGCNLARASRQLDELARFDRG